MRRIDGIQGHHGYPGSHRRRGPYRLDARHRPRAARRALHRDRAEGRRRSSFPRWSAATPAPWRSTGAWASWSSVRAAGLPAHCPMDIFIVLSLVEPPLVHHVHPSVAEAKAQIARCEDGASRSSPISSISQYTLEPLLKSIAETLAERHRPLRLRARVVRSRTRIGHRRRSERRRPSAMRAAYIVGCDGGGSLVRRQLGIALSGEANMQELRQALYYCEDLYERIPIGKGRHYHVADDEATLPHRAGFDPAFHPAFRRRERRRHGRHVRAGRRHAGRSTRCSMSGSGA